MSDHAAREDRVADTEPAVGPDRSGPSGCPPATPSECARGGELNAAFTSALVGIHHHYLGRGPTAASTFHHGNVVVTLMHDILTQAEKALIGSDRADVVHEMRHRFQDVMQADFREAIERLSGRRVIAFISGNDVESDVAAELFVLDAPL